MCLSANWTNTFFMKTDLMLKSMYDGMNLSAVVVEPYCSIFLPDHGCFLRVFEIICTFFKKSEEKIWK